jgi:hypothetical protein
MAVRGEHVLVQLGLVPVERRTPVVVEEQLDAGQPQVRAIPVSRLVIEEPWAELVVAEVDRQVRVDTDPELTGGILGPQVGQPALVDELLADAGPATAQRGVDGLLGPKPTTGPSPIQCACESMKPGITVRPPRSTTCVARRLSASTRLLPPTARIRPSRIATASARGCRSSIVTTMPLW